MNLLNNINILDKQKFEWGEISWIHEPMDSPYRRLSVALVKIYPRCKQDKHFHVGEEQLFYVMQGQGTFVTNGKREDIHKTMMIYIPPHSEHEVVNTGKEDLVFIVVYVPIKLLQLEKPYMVAAYKNIQDAIPLEILQNMKEQLSEILKMEIHIYDGNYQLLTKNSEEEDFCMMCKSVHPCNKKGYVGENTNQSSDQIYKCDYGLIQLEIPITLNESILGYIKSESFILSNSQETDRKIDAIGERLGIDRDLVWTVYKKNPVIIKSRIYVIQEHLMIAAQLMQVMLERSILEHELIKKDNEILINTEEKIQLKEALKKANNKIYNDKIFAYGSTIEKEIAYPYGLELTLEEAIIELDIEKIDMTIDNYKSSYFDSEEIVQEMIIVLSRTALRGLENLEIISHMRKKYNKYLKQIKKEDPWQI